MNIAIPTDFEIVLVRLAVATVIGCVIGLNRELYGKPAGMRTHVTPVAVFNDAGLMLQATEQNLGLALSREILAADALGDGRLVQLSSVSIVHRGAQPYHFVYPPSLRDWAPIESLRRWLRDELDASYRALHAARLRVAGADPAPRKRRKSG